jgi:hypothetical protein
LLFQNGEQGWWYDPSDFSTLFQDAAGTTPVTAVEQPCGLMLDKRLGLVLGSELVTNGDFATDSDWTKGTGWTISGGSANKVGGSASNLTQTISSATGKWYRINVFVARIAGTLTFSIGTSGTTAAFTATGTYTFYVAAGTSTQTLTIAADASFIGFIDNISVRELPGNHAYTPAAASTARPTVSARVNQLVNTEWSGAVAGTPGTVPTNWSFVVSTGQISAVNGNQLTFTTSASRIVLGQSVSYLANSVNRATFTVHANSGVSAAQIFTWSQSIAGATESFFANGVSQTVATYVPVAGDVLSYQLKLGATAGSSTIRIGNGCSNNATGVVTLSKPDIRELNDGVGIPAYQRVNTATDYDPVGFPVYLRADGSNDYLLTNSIDFSAGPSNAPYGSNLVNISALPTPVIQDFGGSTGVWSSSTRSISNTTLGTDTTYPRFQFNIGMSVGRWYLVSGQVTGDLTALNRIRLNNTGSANEIPYNNSTGVFFGIAVAAQSTIEFLMNGTLSVPRAVSIQSLSVRELLDSSLAPDKMTVCAGVRKLSDAAVAYITELSVSSGANNGTFMFAGPGAALNSYTFRSRGSTLSDAEATSAAPITNVITGLGNISGDSAILRINGAQAASNTADQGTGNYGNYPLYLFSRAGSASFFNGRFYGSVGRGAQSNAQQIAALEGYMNNLTKAY